MSISVVAVRRVSRARFSRAGFTLPEPTATRLESEVEEKDDESHGDCKGEQGIRSGRPAQSEADGGNGEIQRRIDQSGHPACGRWIASEFQRQAGAIFRPEAHDY